MQLEGHDPARLPYGPGTLLMSLLLPTLGNDARWASGGEIGFGPVQSMDTMRCLKKREHMSGRGLPYWRAATPTGFDRWAAAMEKTEASLARLLPPQPKWGQLWLPEWGDVCCSVGTRGGEEGRAGEGGANLCW